LQGILLKRKTEKKKKESKYVDLKRTVPHVSDSALPTAIFQNVIPALKRNDFLQSFSMQKKIMLF